MTYAVRSTLRDARDAIKYISGTGMMCCVKIWNVPKGTRHIGTSTWSIVHNLIVEYFEHTYFLFVIRSKMIPKSCKSSTIRQIPYF